MEAHEFTDRMFIDVYGADTLGIIRAMANGYAVAGTHTDGKNPDVRKRVIVWDANTPVGVYRRGEKVPMVPGDVITLEIPGKGDQQVEYQPGVQIEVHA